MFILDPTVSQNHDAIMRTTLSAHKVNTYEHLEQQRKKEKKLYKNQMGYKECKLQDQKF